MDLKKSSKHIHQYSLDVEDNNKIRRSILEQCSHQYLAIKMSCPVDYTCAEFYSNYQERNVRSSWLAHSYPLYHNRNLPLILPDDDLLSTIRLMIFRNSIGCRTATPFPVCFDKIDAHR